MSNAKKNANTISRIVRDISRDVSPDPSRHIVQRLRFQNFDSVQSVLADAVAPYETQFVRPCTSFTWLGTTIFLWDSVQFIASQDTDARCRWSPQKRNASLVK